MKTQIRISLLICPVLLLFTVNVYGAGFALVEHGARASAMGGAFIAQADDLSALFYNPAGITQLEGSHAGIGFTAITPGGSFKSDTGISAKMKTHTWWLPTLYLTYQVTDRLWLGLGGFSHFGLEVEWPDDWIGRYNATNSEIKTFTINPNLAVKINKQLSVAAGMMIQWFDVTLEKMIDGTNGQNPSPTTDIHQKLSGDSWGCGFNFALRYQPFSWLSFGASYRSEIRQDVKGDITFDIPAPLSGLRIYFPNTTGKATLRLPEMLMLGVAVRPEKRLTVEFATYYTDWRSYKDLTVHFDQPIAGQYTSSTPKNWKDVWSFRLSLEYKLNSIWALRAGYVYDNSPIPDETIDFILPTGDRQLFSFGVGYKTKALSLDIFYTYLIIKDRTTEYSTAPYIVSGRTNNADAHLVGLSLNYHF